MDNENKQKPIEQCPTDYGNAMNFETLNGSHILREVITDTYVTQDGNEDAMIKQLDSMSSYAYEKRFGFAGYLSWCYSQFTLLFLLEQYKNSKTILSRIEDCMTCVEKYIMTGNYLDENGHRTMFRNYSFGEPDEDMPKTLQYAKDCYETARLVHKKAGSFESGYAFLVASILYHLAISESGEAMEDCTNMRKLIGHINTYVDGIIENPPKSNIGDDGKEFGDYSDVLKNSKEVVKNA